MTHSASRLAFRQYLEFRLGPLGGRQAWFNFFIRRFGARSFAQFWRLWNPVYGCFLSHFVYRPLARALPRLIAVVGTFLVCGFVVHDVPAWAFTTRILPPGATIAFLFFGGLLVISEALRSRAGCRWMAADADGFKAISAARHGERACAPGLFSYR